MKKNLKLKERFLIPTIISGLILLTSIVSFMSISMFSTVKKEAFHNAQNISNSISEEITGKFQSTFEVINTISLISSSLTTQNVLTRNMLISILFKALEENSFIFGLGSNWEPDSIEGKDIKFIGQTCTDITGRFFLYVIRDEQGKPTFSCQKSGYDFSKDETAEVWYHYPKKLNIPYMTNPYLYPLEGKNISILMTTLNAPIKVNGKFIGTTGADIDILFLQDMVSKIKPYSNGFITIFSNNMRILAHQDKSLIDKEISDEKYKHHIKLALESKSEATFHSTDPVTKKEWYNVLKPIFLGSKNYPWIVTVSIPMDKILKPAYDTLIIVVISGIVGIILYILVLVKISSSISKTISIPVIELENFTKDNAQKSINLKKSAEIVLQKATIQLQNTINVNNFLENIKSGIQKNTTEAQLTIQTVSQVNQTVSEGKKVMLTFQESIKQISNSNNELQVIINIINEIDKKTQLIHNIVEKTELLSLNASIEASRAGEYGKGFLVVAAEVSNLAKSSGDSAKDIQVLITDSKKKILSVLSEIDNKIQGVSSVSKNVIEVFTKIDGSILTISEKINNNFEFADKQNNEVLKNESFMTEINNSAKSNIESAHDLEQLAVVLEKNSSSMNKLTDSVKQFIIG